MDGYSWNNKILRKLLDVRIRDFIDKVDLLQKSKI